MSSLCCHFNWEYVGSGRIGNGGVGTISRLEIANLNSRKSVLMHKVNHSLNIMVEFFFSFLICSL